jgi:uncharacterized membrane protein
MLNPWLAGIISFLHVFSAVVAIGGTFFLHVMLNRGAAREGGLDPALKTSLTRRWQRVLWHAIALLVLTGSINLWSAIAGGVYGPRQHMLFGIKFLIFLGIVTVLTLLTVNTPWVQARRGKLLTLNVILGGLIILMSTLLRRSY